MKLYVWTDVLTDYTSGMITALAPDLETALQHADDTHVRQEMAATPPAAVIDLDGSELMPHLWYVWGGG